MSNEDNLSNVEQEKVHINTYTDDNYREIADKDNDNNKDRDKDVAGSSIGVGNDDDIKISNEIETSVDNNKSIELNEKQAIKLQV